MKEIMRFAVGDVFLCVEEQPSAEHVVLRVRERKGNGRPGRTLGAETQRRSELFAIGMGLHAVASTLIPEQSFDQSKTMGASRRKMNRIPLREQERQALNRILAGDPTEPQRSIQIVNAMYRKLQRRMHVVQRCVQLMEVLSDQDAHQIDLLLALAATGRPLPFSIHVGLEPSGELEGARNGVTH
ncbi:hypothetical protein OII53_21085 [Achromobacter ruhlandii]|uniref:hypothetical protein n=1 Tax=Achromobacter TaxID=222 RepID=UPI0014695511|nr:MULTISPECIES: hypothetical protein [Achromobacter]MCV6799173.1 hypothetical protein [Achromobacter ruhlandii]MCV6804685.1 hypothetical protein [Achromobacter ruhlandii]MCV6811195.1 hypothetical protein [Achromobacter ruhlandii]MCV6821047.1 hypothetical protein [Achromobacter ruhlandii]CAB3873179.1 hypothetical protein LMG26684_03186 [Achromobacter mucicolens]